MAAQPPTLPFTPRPFDHAAEFRLGGEPWYVRIWQDASGAIQSVDLVHAGWVHQPQRSTLGANAHPIAGKVVR